MAPGAYFGAAFYADGLQTIMDPAAFVDFVAKTKTLIFSSTLIFPLYAAALSAFVFLIQLIFSTRLVQGFYRKFTKSEPVSGESDSNGIDRTVLPTSGVLDDLKQHIADVGGAAIYTFRVVRLLGCLALLGMAVVTFVIDIEEDDTIGLASHKKRPHEPKAHKYWLSKREWLAAALCVTYLYVSLLATISVSAGRRWANVAISHLNFVLIVTMGIYTYRDIAPLATFTKHPRDIKEGNLLWGKVAVLALVSIVVPLFVPRQYVPVDPANPGTPNPEQTAPILSLILFTWLDPLVAASWKVAHLSYDAIPAIADYDTTKYLKQRAFKHLDSFSGAPKRHLFWGLMHVFAVDYFILALTLIVRVFADLAGPIGINRLLHYLETKDASEVTYRPWVWIIWLFVGPTISSIAFDWYIFIATRVLVRAEGLLTQLVFEHALRIRMKAETTSSKSTPPSETSTPAASLPPSRAVTPSPDGTHTTEPSEATLNDSDDGGHSRTTTLQDSSEEAPKKDAPAKGDKKDEKAEDADANLIGKINNLVTTDLGNITDSRDFMILLVYTPTSVVLCIAFLYAILGWSSLVGLAVIILMMPVPGFLAKLLQDAQVATLKKTDGRVQVISEIVNVLRMVKLFGWEGKMEERVANKREEELQWIKRRQLLDLAVGLVNFVIPLITMMATFATYTMIMKQDLSASKVFSSMTIFDMFTNQLHRLLFTISQVTAGKASLDRLSNFLRNTELLDEYSATEPAPIQPTPAEAHADKIGFTEAAFSWSNEENSGAVTPSKKEFQLHIEEELVFKKNAINLVVGPTGCGKTSLLMALLGEMHFIPSGPGSWFNLPRESGIAYAAQESWVLNETIKENILFGNEFDEARYKKVIRQCGLKRDLQLFDAGDATEVGEKGLTLSGGQKARITLARAIYSKAQIILLDDVLAALDVHTSKWIVNKCLQGDLVKGRTVILVTHNIAMTEPIAEFVVALKDGRVTSQGTLSSALANNKSLRKEAEHDAEALERDEQDIQAEDDDEDDEPENAKKGDGKLILAEEIQEGHLSWKSMAMYLSALGGNHTFLFFFLFLSTYMAQELAATIQTWWLGHWAAQYETHNSADINPVSYLSVYAILLAGAFVLFAVSYVVYVYGAIRASRRIMAELVHSIMTAALRWLDTTPTSRIIARCTQDIRSVDGPVAEILMYLFHLTVTMAFKFAAVVVFAPAFFFPGLFVGLLGYYLGQIYMKAQLSIKREMSNAKSPVLAHFGAAIVGLTSIRAYGTQLEFVEESYRRIDKYVRTARTYYNLNRWIDIRIDALASLFSASLAFYMVYIKQGSASDTGFAMNMAIGFSSMILWWVRLFNQFEVQGNSLERIQGYLEIEHEPEPKEEGKPPAYWPASGRLVVEGLSARYSPDGPKILHDLNFEIRSGERIGIVGRTGSGKSSLTLSLLRCIYNEGTVYYDGVPTSSLNLDELRTKITIIPQVPELLSGTLRQNLDPFDQCDDATLNDALRAAGLFSLQSETEEGRITLDSSISSGGSNLSVGQRQIIALARALVRQSKILLLDEATSAIDYKTDSIIQSSLRHELGADTTLITVAHRLQTIMDADRIMVLDAGRIVEFDSPQALLKIPGGKLKSLVDESGDRDLLYEMALKQHAT